LIFGSSYLGNTWHDLVEISNVGYWQWRASPQQKSSGFMQVARSYLCTNLCYCSILTASLTTRHTTVCLDYWSISIYYITSTCNKIWDQNLAMMSVLAFLWLHVVLCIDSCFLCSQILRYLDSEMPSSYSSCTTGVLCFMDCLLYSSDSTYCKIH